jgi:hypothetical protein
VTAPDHLSDLRWDRLLAGDLAPADAAAARDHAATCPRCGARLRELEADRDAFARRPFAIPRAIHPRPRGLWAGAAAALAAAAVLVVVLRRHDGGDGEGTRTKGRGGPALLLSAGPADRLAPLATRDVVHPGDSLQAGYTSARAGFGAVLSRDGAGQAASYVPYGGDHLVALPAGTRRSFPASTILDATPGEEHVAIVWCDADRPLAPLIDELRATGTLAERAGCTIRVVAITKVAAP